MFSKDNDAFSEAFTASGRRPIELKSGAELEKMRAAGKAVARVLQKLGESLAPGVTTQYIDDLAFREISSLGMKPAFLGYRGYPATANVSINEELVHGIPRQDRVIKDGDIVSIDVGLVHQGFYSDNAATFGVGKISKAAQRLLDVTRESLDRAIGQVAPSKRLGGRILGDTEARGKLRFFRRPGLRGPRHRTQTARRTGRSQFRQAGHGYTACTGNGLLHRADA
jgi:Methionine aminopeptidase